MEETIEDLLMAVYQTTDVDTLVQSKRELKPLSVPALLNTFTEDMVEMIGGPNTKRPDYQLNDNGRAWKRLAERFTPVWIHFAIAKKEGRAFPRFNWFLYTQDYFEHNPILTFPEYHPGIKYEKKNGAWKLLKNETADNTFSQDLIKSLQRWGIVDDKVMNTGLNSTKKLTVSQTFCGRVNRPTELAHGKRLAAFNNGTYNFETGQVQPHLQSDYLLNIHNYDVDFNSHSAPETDRMLQAMLGPAATFFKEFIGYCFYPSHDIFQDFILLHGQGGEGKSTLLRYIEQDVIGTDNFCAITPHNMAEGQDRFNTSALYGKEANIVPDISSKPLPDISLIKGLLGADSIDIQFKFKDHFTMTSCAKNIWSANKLPTIQSDDVNRAIADRANVIEVINGNTRNASNHFWANHNMAVVKKERPQFVGECLYLFQQVLKRFKQGQGKESWTKPETIKKATQDWLTNSDPIKQWLDSVKEECPSLFEGGYFVKKDAYDDYRIWCQQEGRKAMKKQKWVEALTTRFGFMNQRHRQENGSRPYCLVNGQLAKQWNDEGVDWTINCRG